MIWLPLMCSLWIAFSLIVDPSLVVNISFDGKAMRSRRGLLRLTSWISLLFAITGLRAIVLRRLLVIAAALVDCVLFSGVGCGRECLLSPAPTLRILGEALPYGLTVLFGCLPFGFSLSSSVRCRVLLAHFSMSPTPCNLVLCLL